MDSFLPQNYSMTELLSSPSGISSIKPYKKDTIINMDKLQTMWNIKILSELPCGLHKCALRVELPSKLGESIYNGSSVVMLFNKPPFSTRQKPFPPDFDSLNLAYKSTYTPKLFFSYVHPVTGNYVMIQEDVMHGATQMCTRGLELNFEQQVDLLTAFLKLGELGLAQDDPNCGNIIIIGDNVKIIDDISKIRDDEGELISDKPQRLYYAMTQLSKLQFNDDTSILLQFTQENVLLGLEGFKNQFKNKEEIINQFKQYYSNRRDGGGKKKRINKTRRKRRKRRHSQKRRRSFVKKMKSLFGFGINKLQ